MRTVKEAALDAASRASVGDTITIKGVAHTFVYRVTRAGVRGNWFAGVAFQEIELVSKTPNPIR
mgnify:CR=1 FL=1